MLLEVLDMVEAIIIIAMEPVVVVALDGMEVDRLISHILVAEVDLDKLEA